MLVDRKYDIAAIVLLVLCLVAYASFRSEYHLRPDMPREFFDASKIPHAKRSTEEKIAKAYWNSAVFQVQWKYGYAYRLPEDPPAEFSITAELGASAAQDPLVRALYWQRLRKVWDMSTVWQEQYTWNFSSLTQSLRSAGDWLEEVMRRLTGY